MSDSIITLNESVIATGWLAASLFFGFLLCVFALGFILGRAR